MSKKRISFFIGIWVLVAAAAIAVMLSAPKTQILSNTEEQTWEAPVEWMPSRVPTHSVYVAREAIYPALDEGYLAYLAAKNAEEEVHGPPYIPQPPKLPVPVEEGPKPVLTVPESAKVMQGGGSYKEVRVAIIIDDMGMGNSTRAITNLPAEITLAYLPYAPNLQEQVRDALSRGHEILLHLPMEPMGYENPGPGALLTTLSFQEISIRLSKALNSFDGFVGVNNHMGSKFTKYREGMEYVLEVLREKGLFFIDSLTTGASLGGPIAKQVGVRTATRDVFLDDEISSAAIKKQLERLEQVARRDGTAIAIGHPHKATLQALEEWVKETDKRRIRIVPASELLE